MVGWRNFELSLHYLNTIFLIFFSAKIQISSLCPFPSPARIVFIHRLAKADMEWAMRLSRRIWTTKLRPIGPEPRMEQFSVGEEEDDCDDQVYFVGLRGGFYSLKRYMKIKSS